MHEREVSAQGKFNCMTTATELSLSASKTRARPRARLSFPPTLRDDYFARDLLSFLLSPRNCGRLPFANTGNLLRERERERRGMKWAICRRRRQQQQQQQLRDKLCSPSTSHCHHHREVTVQRAVTME